MLLTAAVSSPTLGLSLQIIPVAAPRYSAPTLFLHGSHRRGRGPPRWEDHLAQRAGPGQGRVPWCGSSWFRRSSDAMNKKSQPDAQGYHFKTAPAGGHTNVRETSEGRVSLTPTPENCFHPRDREHLAGLGCTLLNPQPKPTVENSKRVLRAPTLNARCALLFLPQLVTSSPSLSSLRLF